MESRKEQREIRRREKTISIKLFSDNNAILIGKNGRTIGALQTIIRQIISKETQSNHYIVMKQKNTHSKCMTSFIIHQFRITQMKRNVF